MKDARELETRRPRGRPRVDVPRVSVSTWIPTTHYDRLFTIAKQQQMSVSALVCRVLRQNFLTK